MMQVYFLYKLLSFFQLEFVEWISTNLRGEFEFRSGVIEARTMFAML